MQALHFIGGEKGGVGKSVLSRVLAQHHIDHGRPFVGFDTDRSHQSFRRFYGEYAHPTAVDDYESLDAIANVFEAQPGASVLVDLAAQTFEPVARWMQESGVLEVLELLEVRLICWHLLDGSKDSVELFGRLLDSFGTAPTYVAVRNLGRGGDFTLFDNAPVKARALQQGARIIDLPKLHDACMRKIDQNDLSFWAAINTRGSGSDALGLLERQRAKIWLQSAYRQIDTVLGE